MNKTDFFPIGDYLTTQDWEGLGLNHLTFNEKMIKRHSIMGKFTGEKRRPKAGEWFLSGSVVYTYRTKNDLSIPYHIAKLVQTETVTFTREI